MTLAGIDVVLQEVPGEVSLAVALAGCPNNCKDCHSPWLQARNIEVDGGVVDPAIVGSALDKYQGLVTCLLLLGGEWDARMASALLDEALARKLHTAMYAGTDVVPFEIRLRLTYLKTGRWNPALGGLGTMGTNQVLVDLRTKTEIKVGI